MCEFMIPNLERKEIDSFLGRHLPIQHMYLISLSDFLQTLVLTYNLDNSQFDVGGVVGILCKWMSLGFKIFRLLCALRNFS